MKHVIVGTAGHIDHGKTTLIKALTGRETDTLREEKDRGISINLGFTFFDLPSKRRAGIIDVPGHEKFVKNMLAGVSSVDIVILVIAADEGIMPQTEEHFEILQLLNVKKGIVALTKADLVDEEWLDMMKEEVKERFKGTFLENSPIIPVSSKTKMGMDELINTLDEATEEVEGKDTEGHFRLPVDRVFSVSGFGTVVTGTIISGKVKEGDMVTLYPSMAQGKIRTIQVHEENVPFAEAGQRCALNISGVKKDDVERGDVVSIEHVMEPSMIIDSKIYHIKNADKSIENRQRLRLYHGTSEILCRIVILDKEEIKPGEEAYVQLRLEAPLTAQRNDRYVLRTYSPMYTIAGGNIIEPKAKKAKRFNEKYLEELKIKESGEAGSIIENTIKNISDTFSTSFDIIKALGKNEEGIEDKLKALVEEGLVIELTSLDKSVYLHKSFIKKKSEDLELVLNAYHKENPLKYGMAKEEIKNKIFGKSLKQKNYDDILKVLQDREVIKQENNLIAFYTFEIKYTKEQKEIKNRIINAFEKGGYTPPKYEDLGKFEKDKKSFKMVYDSLIDNGELIRLADDIVFTKNHYEKAKDLVKDFINKNGGITPADGRDILNSSRKYVVSLFEHFDSIKLTKRLEDKRVLF
ncbi:selenocysteine-specific translation elongation factor [Clostridium hydrogeniformans]|uniref:selenocysteine-specific translation elongation factor n=1 Tax=Clostridium hydrogeniformans TaxID=349933 RepID=UPI000487A608|nr:selenocysteine-specific translation elongation factor [Clostridium hydrogeniformans]